ncbi:putative vacuolar protein sorting-associated, VPS28 [Lupinus albus]|uniref:Putative vacuolar protein sorting-associated, VPS28 n=1 Tax=Lupinus albus TaxID=3870 RepID=A0A6A4NS33_LUPAL|nr:putative vacuolar protein sorting-associated, VPS28 [Lupinus albus]
MNFEKAYVRYIISPNGYDEFYCNNFILHFNTMDHVHPLFTDLFGSLNKFTILPPHFEGKTKMKE